MHIFIHIYMHVFAYNCIYLHIFALIYVYVYSVAIWLTSRDDCHRTVRPPAKSHLTMSQQYGSYVEADIADAAADVRQLRRRGQGCTRVRVDLRVAVAFASIATVRGVRGGATGRANRRPHEPRARGRQRPLQDRRHAVRASEGRLASTARRDPGSVLCLKGSRVAAWQGRHVAAPLHGDLPAVSLLLARRLRQRIRLQALPPLLGRAGDLIPQGENGALQETPEELRHADEPAPAVSASTRYRAPR